MPENPTQPTKLDEPNRQEPPTPHRAPGPQASLESSPGEAPVLQGKGPRGE
ncbi:hypothetical protein BCY84_22769 [Trypanosoma cruzi cruzi]|nr:hypothetical protein BCY84_22769 [Trypanosoma cruzi cruzi]